MRKTLTIILITAFASTSWAQNTFPSSGAVGIGISNPGFPLSVYQTTSGWQARFNNGSSNVYLAHYANYGMHINSGGNNDASKYALQIKNSQSELLYVRGDGYLGIGTSLPSYPLHINKTTSDWQAQFQNGSSNVYIAHGTNYGMHINPGGNDDASKYALQIKNSESELFFVRGDGKVGVGTTIPTAELDIYGDVNLNNQYSPNPGYLNPGYYVFKNGTTRYGMKLHHSNGEYGTMIFGPNQVDRFINFGKFNSELSDDSMTEYMRIDLDDGNVGIGTTTPDAKLTVKGDIHAEEVTVDLSVPGPDYVFEEDYELTTLEETETYIKTHKHLPEIPSAKEMEEKGIDLGEMNMLLLKKIEELTLHVMGQNKRIELLENQPK